jgi:hypothetical protein
MRKDKTEASSRTTVSVLVASTPPDIPNQGRHTILTRRTSADSGICASAAKTADRVEVAGWADEAVGKF